jgi:hypothetical protein
MGSVSAVMWSQMIGTVFLGLVGLWLAHNIRRQIRVKLAERRVDAYAQLWSLTAIAIPTRSTPLDAVERSTLCGDINRWFFHDGNGIFMPRVTRDLLVAVQHNLICPVGSIKPEALAAQLTELPGEEAERRRGCASIRQVSLLRTQLKVDLSLHAGFRHLSDIHPVDLAFLRTCGLSPWRQPWRQQRFRIAGRAGPNSCICGTCDQQSPFDQRRLAETADQSINPREIH